MGFVNPIDENGNVLSKAGVTVTITSVTPQLTQTSDANGRYEFTNQRNGTYNLTFSRLDLGTNKIFGYGFVGGDQPSLVGTTYLSAVSRTTVSNLRVNSPQFSSGSGYYALLTANLYNPTYASNGSYYDFAVAVYGSNTAGVNSTNGTLLGTFYLYQGSGSSNAFQISRAAFNAAGFATNSTVNVIVYGAPGYYSTSYTDIVTGKPVFTSLNPVGSQVVSFIVP